MNNYLKIVNIGKRKGVITTVAIAADTPICEIKGAITTYDKLSELEKPENALQIGPSTYICPSGSVTDKIRHSCNANCVVSCVGNRAVLYSKHFIAADSEITFDYSSTSSENKDSWIMNCNCGSYNCRKLISGFYELDKDLQDEYKQNKVAALYIREPIFLRK